jgi:hypothetical protein
MARRRPWMVITIANTTPLAIMVKHRHHQRQDIKVENPDLLAIQDAEVVQPDREVKVEVHNRAVLRGIILITQILKHQWEQLMLPPMLTECNHKHL